MLGLSGWVLHRLRQVLLHLANALLACHSQFRVVTLAPDMPVDLRERAINARIVWIQLEGLLKVLDSLGETIRRSEFQLLLASEEGLVSFHAISLYAPLRLPLFCRQSNRKSVHDVLRNLVLHREDVS